MTYLAEVLADSPNVYWRLSDTASPLVDGIAAKNLTVTGTVTYAQTGALTSDPTDKGLKFTAANVAYAQRTWETLLNPAAPFTVECWLRTTGTYVSDQYVLHSSNNTTRGYGFVFTAGQAGKLDVRWYNGTTYSGVRTTAALTANTWYHYVFTYDGTQGRAYLNGSLQGSAVTFGFSAETTSSFRLGMPTTVAQSQYAFDGTIDEVAVYPTALSQTRISAHYNAGIAAGPTTFPQTLTATATAAPTIVRRTGKLVATTPTVTPAITRRAAKTLTATPTVAATVTALRVFLRTLSATATTTVTVTRRANKLIATTPTAVATVTRRVAKTTVFTATAAGSIVRQTTIRLTVTPTTAATLGAVRILTVTPQALTATPTVTATVETLIIPASVAPSFVPKILVY